MLRDRVAQVLPTLGYASTPGYGYVLGMYAFGLEETALYSRAEDIGRRALEINRRDAWAVHAVTHVMEMQGRLRDGIDWLSAREHDWAVNNGFAFHNWWHLALFHLDLGNFDAGARAVRSAHPPAPSQVPLEMIDATALLWRLELRAANVQSIAGRISPSAGSRSRACLLRVQRCACRDGFRSRGSHRSRAASHCGDGAQGGGLGYERDDDARRRLAAGTGRRRVRERAATATRSTLLQPIRTIANRFGGSHAQRDLIHLTLVEAALARAA